MLKKLSAVASLAAAFPLFALAVAATPPQDARNSNRARPAPSTEIPPAPELPPAVVSPTPNPSSGMGTGMGIGSGGGYGPGRGQNVGGGDTNYGGGSGGYSGGDVDYDRPFRANQVTAKAVIISKPEPDFTEEAQENDTQGLVRLRAVLWKDGAVKNISVIKGLPDGLTEKAIAAARKIKFRPARKDGREVSMWVTLEYNFTIYEDEDRVERRAVILEQPAAEYTEEARRNKTEGKVVLEVMLSRDGTAGVRRVLTELPHGLTEQARKAAGRIKFTPAEDGGRQVSVVRRVEYVFSLR
jgi:TonB family protein